MKTYAFVLSAALLVLIVSASESKRKPCDWRCNAPECTCVSPGGVPQCICAGEKSLGEKCYDELQCNGGHKCLGGVCKHRSEGLRRRRAHHHHHHTFDV